MEKYSFSKIKCYLSCPLCFYKRYFEKPEKDNPELAASHGTSEFGSFVHEILEKYEKNELAIWDMLPYYKKHYDEKVTSDFNLRLTETFTKNFAKDYYDSGKEYLENFYGFPDYKILEAEYEFEEVINDSFIFTGKIDLIVEDEDKRLIIIDHKSKAAFKNKSERTEYAKQLYLYAYAVQKKHNRFPDKLMFNMFRKDKWESFDFIMNDYINALDWLISMVKEIEESLEFPALKDTFYCWNFCPYRYANFEECKVGE